MIPCKPYPINNLALPFYALPSYPFPLTAAVRHPHPEVALSRDVLIKTLWILAYLRFTQIFSEIK